MCTYSFLCFNSHCNGSVCRRNYGVSIGLEHLGDVDRSPQDYKYQYTCALLIGANIGGGLSVPGMVNVFGFQTGGERCACWCIE